MADAFDEVYGSATPTATALPSSSMDAFDEVYGASQGSDWEGVRNAAVKGFGAPFGLIDLLANVVKKPFTDKPLPISFQKDYENEARNLGLLTDARAQSTLGKFGENIAETATSAAGFGPAAMIVSGTASGIGGGIGEAAGGETGKAIGQIVGGFTPVGVNKLGIGQELASQMGPLVEQTPGLRKLLGMFGVKLNSTEKAVGTALMQTLEKPADTVQALDAFTPSINPLDKLKTTAEVVGDRGLARAEDAFNSMTPSSSLPGLTEQRIAARESNVLGQLFDPSITPYERSKDLESAITSSGTAVKSAVDDAWSALDKTVPVSTKLENLDDLLNSKVLDATYDGAIPLEGAAKGLLAKYKTAQAATEDGVISMGAIQELRSKALKLARATASGTNEADRASNEIANALESHLRNVVNANADAGLLPTEVADTWAKARTATAARISTFAAPKVAGGGEGTVGLENLVLKGLDPQDAKLLQEGLSSPDKLAAQIRAADVGGQDIRPIYKEALKAEIEGKNQSQWADIIARKRMQWEQVFSPEEMAAIDMNLADIESGLSKGRISTVGGSQTNPRGNVQDILNSGRGIAGAFRNSTLANTAPALIGGAFGAQKGWNESEDTGTGLLKSLLYGTVGAVGGKTLSNAAGRANASYDEILQGALRSPERAKQVLDAAKPSKLGQLLTQGIIDTGKVTALKGASNVLGSALKKVLPPVQTQPPLQSSDTSTPKSEIMSKADIANIGQYGTQEQQAALESSVIKNMREKGMTEAQARDAAYQEFKDNPLMKGNMSKADDFVAKEEGGQLLKAYPPPAKGSGVTVATGIDLGQRSIGELKALGLSGDLLAKVSPYIGKKDAEAKTLLSQQPLTLTKSEASELDNLVKKDIYGTLRSKLETEGINFDTLPSEAQTVLQSLAWNFGKNVDQKIPSIWNAMVNKDWEEAQKLLNNTKWKQPELKARRQREAELLGNLVV